MSVNFLATSVPFEPDDFAVIFGIYPIDRTSVGVLAVGEADSVSSVSASACHSSGPKGVSPVRRVSLHGTSSNILDA